MLRRPPRRMGILQHEKVGRVIRLIRFWRLGGNDLRLLWFALRHERRPVWLWPAAVCLGVYALEPINLAIPFVGIIDDFVLLPLALHCLLRFLPADIRSSFSQRSLLSPGPRP
jgi:uncharacterized membrane protein YkvA (DUF1232 family)